MSVGSKLWECIDKYIFQRNNDTEAGINKYKGYSIVFWLGTRKYFFYLCEATSDVTSKHPCRVTSMENLSFNWRNCKQTLVLFLQNGGKK
jgi:hypothetical protein